jgi:hypothetical protein
MERFGLKWSEQKASPLHAPITDFMSIFKSYAPLPAETRLYEGRGVYEDVDHFGPGASAVGDVVVQERMLSTSWNPNVAINFADERTGCLVVYEIAPGVDVRAIPVESIEPPVGGPGGSEGLTAALECEIILPPFLRCVVQRIEVHETLPYQVNQWENCVRCKKRLRIVFVLITGVAV